MTESEARELLENTALKKSQEAITNEYLSQIANSAAEDFEGRGRILSNDKSITKDYWTL